MSSVDQMNRITSPSHNKSCRSPVALACVKTAPSLTPVLFVISLSRSFLRLPTRMTLRDLCESSRTISYTTGPRRDFSTVVLISRNGWTWRFAR